MTWFDIDGQLYEEFGVSEKALVAAGGRGWATQAEAEANSQPTNPALKLATLDLAVFHTVANPGAVVSNSLGIPSFTNTRDLVVRAVKVIIGALLIVLGVNSLMKDQGIDVPKVVPV